MQQEEQAGGVLSALLKFKAAQAQRASHYAYLHNGFKLYLSSLDEEPFR
jgi:hypothetical protein